MATLGKGYTFGATETVTSAKLATLVDSGTVSNIIGADISASAISDIKISDVSGAKFTNLSSVPGAAGLLPIVNGGTGYSTAASLLGAIYPVGIVITLGVSTNPNTLFGFGTWSAIAGRVIVGIDAGQTEFDVLDETGGAKTHTLVAGEIPSHTHSVSFTSCNNNSGAGESGYVVEGQVPNGNSTVDATSGSTGSGGAHNNLQPYIVKYVWQRTA